MRLRQLKLRLQTADGPYGATIDFPDGLVVVWADNSMGKSTCVKSILVALGLEAMLTTNQSELPLTPAVLTRLQGEGDREVAVTESEVYLEIENGKSERIVVQRTLKGSRDNHLVTVHSGPALTSPTGTYPATDYFVNRPGGASRERGFHHFLAGFLGWELPQVPNYDGTEVPLYLQYLFPYFVVEQTRGWSTIQPPVPTHLRVREPGKRAVEFILNLDARKIALRRQELLHERTVLETEWSGLRRQIQELASRDSAEVQNLSGRPTAVWPPEVPPSLMVSEGEKWIPLTERAAARQGKLTQLVSEEIPKVQEIASTAAQELADAERTLRMREAFLARLLEASAMEEAELESLRRRIRAIEEDLKRNQDVETLRSLGSTQLPSVTDGTCPVCHQSMKDTLVPVPDVQAVMSVKENIEFLKDQRKTFQLVLSNAERVAETRQHQLEARRLEANDLRERIRALRQTLVMDGRMPSVAAIRERFQLEMVIRRDNELAEAFTKRLDEFKQLATRWQKNQAELSGLPAGDTTAEDRGKIDAWSKVFREQLTQYGFRSIAVTQTSVSPDTYRPEHDGWELDLQTSISASDLIRTIWSYLHGMLEVARSNATNHPGFLLFDEPRQQSTRDVSFAELLKRASTAARFNQQVIFFTSEKIAVLKGHLGGLPHRFIEFEGRVLRKS